ncbi:uncharacterized protein TNCV_4467801 [Trichonephila clavipes]|nr:uncharacterized protein TNCV_4467801 [Trichonephila clavipes]
MPLLGMVNLLRGRVLKEAWLACAPSLFDDFDNKDKIIQRIKDVPLSRNTMKDRILKLAENVSDQQKMTLTPLLLYRYVLTKKRYYYKKLQVLPKLEKKNITDLDAQEKRNEEKVIDDFISIMDSLIKEFSARFSQFKELSETFKFIMYPDVISFDKLNLSQFDWLEIEELEMQLIDFSLVQYGFKSLLKQGKSWN